MTPYSNFLYFGILIYVAIPTIILGFIRNQKLFKLWIILTTIIMLILQYNGSQDIFNLARIPQIIIFIGFIIYQIIIAKFFLFLKKRGKRPIIFYFFILFSLLPLLIVKIIPIISSTDLIGFLGISYISFRSLDVIININDSVIGELSIVQYFIYMAFFPTISAGPIDRYNRFIKDWNYKRTGTEFASDLDKAVHKIFIGFLYKFILAVLIKQYLLDPVSNGLDIKNIILYMYYYSFYLFFDFAGYSSFAIALSYLFGIHTPENFNLPFLSKNIREFWERWHISLSKWFRDHVYSRFVLRAIRKKWFKSKYIASYVGFYISMGLMGLWHGFNWYYILYGLYHATLLVSYDLYNRWYKVHPYFVNVPFLIKKSIGIFITFNLVCFGLLIFSGRLN